MEKMIVAYVPVLHEGYNRFFGRHQDAELIALIPGDLAAELDPSTAYIRKDLRALDVRVVRSAIAAWYPSTPPIVADRGMLATFNNSDVAAVFPDEDVSRLIAQRFLPNAAVTFDEVFLRWHRNNVLAHETVKADRTVPFTSIAAAMLGLAERESANATNWWRRVGAVITNAGTVLLAGSNRHVPSPHLPYAEGDARSLFHRGELIELTTDHHAEARLIAEAARRGIALDGADLYVTMFPCPPCAKNVAAAGIRRCFFSGGYAMLDGERVLREAGVELIFVQKENPPTGE